MVTIKVFEDGNSEPASWFTIGKPEPTQDGNYACTIELPDLKPSPIFGVTPIDAMENALGIAKASASRVKGPTAYAVD